MTRSSHWHGGGFLFFFGAARLWFGLAWLGSAWFGEPSRTEEKKHAEPGRKVFFFFGRFRLAWRAKPHRKKKKKTAEPGRKGNYFFFGAARLGFGLVWFGRQAAPKKKKSAEPGGRVFRLLRRGSDLVQLGLVRLGLALLFESF